MYLVVLRLHQHFGNACRAAKITINLERWVGIKKVVVGTPTTFVSSYRC